MVVKRLRRFAKRKNEGRWEDNKIGETYAKNSVYKTELRFKTTRAERIVGDWLWYNQIPFTFQKGFVVPFHRIADFYLKTHNHIIEVDGGYHKGIVWKDKQKDSRWRNERGIGTTRITNEEVFSGEFENKLRHYIPREVLEKRIEDKKEINQIKLPSGYMATLGLSTGNNV